jgi:hypothetical protein
MVRSEFLECQFRGSRVGGFRSSQQTRIGGSLWGLLELHFGWFSGEVWFIGTRFYYRALLKMF